MHAQYEHSLMRTRMNFSIFFVCDSENSENSDLSKKNIMISVGS